MLFDWFSPKDYKVKLPKYSPMWSIPVETTADGNYSVGPSRTIPGGVMVRLNVNGNTMTLNMSAAGTQQMIALMNAAMLKEEHTDD